MAKYSTTTVWSYDLMRMMTFISEHSVEFEVCEPTTLTVNGHIAVKHRGNHPFRPEFGRSYQAGVGWGLRVGLRGPFPTLAALRASYGGGPNAQPPTFPQWVHGGAVSGNIEPAALHYFPAPVTAGSAVTQPGFYRAEVWGSCHGSSDGIEVLPDQAVVELLVEGDGTTARPYTPHNALIWDIAPGAFAPRTL